MPETTQEELSDELCGCSTCLYGSKSRKEQKRRAGLRARREARGFINGHEDLILGASTQEIDAAIKRIGNALRALRMAKINAAIARGVEPCLYAKSSRS